MGIKTKIVNSVDERKRDCTIYPGFLLLCVPSRTLHATITVDLKGPNLQAALGGLKLMFVIKSDTATSLNTF